jgi:hypothetical protein
MAYMCQENFFANTDDSQIIMSLMKFVMQPTLHLHRLCRFKKYILILYNILNTLVIAFVKLNENYYL